MDRYDLRGRRAALILYGGGRQVSEYDVERIKKLKKKLSESSVKYIKLGIKQDVTDALESFRDQLPVDVSCLMVVIICHGRLGHIFLSNGEEIQLETIYQMFNNSQCPALREKPKLFVVQACRGVKLKRSERLDIAGGAKPLKTELLPTESDVMVVNAVCPDKLAIRHMNHGCPMIMGISEAFENCDTPPLHMYELFTQVNRRLDEIIPDFAGWEADSTKLPEQGKIGNSLHIVSSLTKKWYLK